MSRTAEQRDFYEVLGVPRDADPSTIRKTFHGHARESHPDVASDPHAVERFREVSHAYEVLSDPRSRLLYDRLAYRGPGGGGFGPVHPGIGRRQREDEHISDHQLLEWIFGEHAPAAPPLTTRDDPVVLGFAIAGFVSSLIVVAAIVLT
jgi:DnaJ-class molecular chaperone